MHRIVNGDRVERFRLGTAAAKGVIGVLHVVGSLPGVTRSPAQVPGGLSGRGAAAQSYREAVVGVLERDIDVELVDEPQPKP